ncbi:site-2 protease family protein [Rhodomicrobium vannielii ATCC 17100]|uniref:site-2 protease family protein n=1 Tax=Rhodomicrobium vannielii TaxID=1069 RepID=UPI0019197CEA|nr:site-2 protease family protein [Rhodomicrobium vannielii]MBJ7534751.1 site-2 protease family protein [Rhodomicrobium vannielii ATCC 17100]
MGGDLNAILYTVSTWVIPLLLAITLHEAAHGFAARRLGDNTAWMLGRVTLNPFKHVDPVGTVLIPAMLLLLRAPFLFGWAKPVPVNFRNLNNPRRDMIIVALAGPGANIFLAVVSALLFYVARELPSPANAWVAQNLVNSILINAILAVFNMLPIPPLDGGRVLTGLLPRRLAYRFEGLEPYGLLLILTLIFLLPFAGRSAGLDLDFFARYLMWASGGVVNAILSVTGIR